MGDIVTNMKVCYVQSIIFYIHDHTVLLLKVAHATVWSPFMCNYCANISIHVLL